MSKHMASASPDDRLTLNTTTALLGGVAVLQALAAIAAADSGGAHGVEQKSGWRWKTQALGATVCVIAFLHYKWMRETPDALERLRLRYGDWIVTTPLLLLELQTLTDGDVPEKAVVDDRWLRRVGALCATMGMVALGYGAERSRSAWVRYPLFAVASLLLAGVTYESVSTARRNKNLVFYFFVLWWLYPLAFLLPESMSGTSNSLYNVLDALAKGVFGMLVATFG